MRTKMFIVLAVLLAIPCLAKVSIREFTLPAVEAAPSEPAVSGDWAVATLNTSTCIGLISYDLKRKEVYTLHRGWVRSPTMTGTTAAYVARTRDIPELKDAAANHSVGKYVLILADVTSGSSCMQRLIGGEYPWTVSASGDYVAYQAGYGIYLYNLRTGADKKISDNRPVHGRPDLDGDMLVWLESGKENLHDDSKVLGYRRSTGKVYEFTQAIEDNGHPRTDGDYVVWYTSGIGTRIHDLKIGKTTILSHANCQNVSNGFMIFLKCPRTGNAASQITYQGTLHGIDLKTKEEFTITSSEKARMASIEGNRVVWIEGNVLHYADLTRTTNELKLYEK